MKETENSFVIFSFDLPFALIDKMHSDFKELVEDKGIMPSEIPIDIIASKYLSPNESPYRNTRNLDDVKESLRKLTEKIQLLNINNKPLSYQFIRRN